MASVGAAAMAGRAGILLVIEQTWARAQAQIGGLWRLALRETALGQGPAAARQAGVMEWRPALAKAARR